MIKPIYYIGFIENYIIRVKYLECIDSSVPLPHYRNYTQNQCYNECLITEVEKCCNCSERFKIDTQPIKTLLLIEVVQTNSLKPISAEYFPTLRNKSGDGSDHSS